MSSPKDRLAAVLASVPNSGTAGRVVGGGDHYEPQVNLNGIHHWVNCPLVLPADSPRIRHLLRKYRRWCQHRVGRLVLVGVWDRKSLNGAAINNLLWIVKCDCGAYEARTFGEMRRPAPPDANDTYLCAVCAYNERVKRIYKKLGPRPIEDFINVHPGKELNQG